MRERGENLVRVMEARTQSVNEVSMLQPVTLR